MFVEETHARAVTLENLCPPCVCTSFTLNIMVSAPGVLNLVRPSMSLGDALKTPHLVLRRTNLRVAGLACGRH